jgi:hypothetical protein
MRRVQGQDRDIPSTELRPCPLSCRLRFRGRRHCYPLAQPKQRQMRTVPRPSRCSLIPCVKPRHAADPISTSSRANPSGASGYVSTARFTRISSRRPIYATHSLHASKCLRAWILPNSACRRTGACGCRSQTEIPRTTAYIRCRSCSVKNSCCAVWTHCRRIYRWRHWDLPPISRRRSKPRARAPHALVLVTGPTGSGKTRSLYCFLQMLNAKSRNVCSVEGPAEIQLAGINQARSAAFRRMWCSLSP